MEIVKGRGKKRLNAVERRQYSAKVAICARMRPDKSAMCVTKHCTQRANAWEGFATYKRVRGGGKVLTSDVV